MRLIPTLVLLGSLALGTTHGYATKFGGLQCGVMGECVNGQMLSMKETHTVQQCVARCHIHKSEEDITTVYCSFSRVLSCIGKEKEVYWGTIMLTL